MLYIRDIRYIIECSNAQNMSNSAQYVWQLVYPYMN
ncbi:hypothetical protein HAPAU_34830 [Halalkalicoccus paucihalophilus]|uniref:Uncharacterized protein n=1 Tax=Halalkalicoccus paucihalophilus TaxID=1008153 RepID=A0A151AAC5_9EURY|nr:hypothetical protein HAPAU_34830 [Halalkalicoccus paucihalophilus]